MRFYCTLGANTYSPLAFFGVQGPPVPNIEKFVELKNFLVGTAPFSVEELRNDLTFNVSMMVVAVLMLLGIFITGRAFAKSVFWLVRKTIGLLRVGSKVKKNLTFDANYFGSVSEKIRLSGLKEMENEVQDMITAYKGISAQLDRLKMLASTISKERKTKVLVKSPVIVTSYPGSDELEVKLDHKDCLGLGSSIQLTFAWFTKNNLNEETAPVNNQNNKGKKSNIPTEDDWLRYYEEELAEQEKLQAASQEKFSKF